MRRKLIAGNWKMYNTIAEALALVGELRPRLAPFADLDLAVFPPFTALAAVARALEGSNIGVGGQNLSAEPRGAFTGEVSAAMLVEAGCRYALVGHSERRQLFGETDEGVHRKAGAAIAAGLIPIVCIGELLAERQAGRTLDVVRRQLEGGLAGFTDAQMKGLVLAYEPVWAIGTGVNATAAQAQEVHAAVRNEVARRMGSSVAEGLRILYGGSVKPENARELLAEPDVDGALVGGASLLAHSFTGIVASC
jgi:triosephosphate isomerase